jgi:hypothetical protein
MKVGKLLEYLGKKQLIKICLFCGANCIIVRAKAIPVTGLDKS